MAAFTKNIFITSFLLLMGVSLFATHNKAGEITYKHITANTYEITITTYTDPSSTSADRCILPIDFGDGQSDSIPRSNGSAQGGCPRWGEVIVPGKIKMNKYVTRHTYAGPGRYVIKMSDKNRIENIRNIPNSVEVAFSIRTTLIIHPTTGSNNSVQLKYPPIDEACSCVPFYHNPGASDPDGDSLSYSLSICYGNNNDPINGYIYPPAGSVCGKKIFEINPVTGTLTWDSPPTVTGKYNVCILVTEWRKVRPNGAPPYWDTVGFTLRDMQIDLTTCTNRPPRFKELNNLCVVAKDTIDKEIIAYDDLGQTVSLEGIGEPLDLFNTPAKFPTPSPKRDTVSSRFYWETQCSHVRTRPYMINFKAKDNVTHVPMANFKTWFIEVIGPKTNNLSILPQGNDMKLNWDVNPCLNIIRYDVYRKTDSSRWNPNFCETGIPNSLGYKLIGSSKGVNNNQFIDDNNDKGLYHGLIYCYRIVAVYANGAESIASDEVCAELPFSTPIINGNSVIETSQRSGIDSISWAKPQEIKLSSFPKPYSFKIYRQTPSGQVLEFTSPDYSTWNSIDTLAVVNNVNTEDSTQYYNIELFSNGVLMGKTHKASSVYLKIKPDDRKLNLLWDEDVPWNNFEYIIYKEINGKFEAIDTVPSSPFVDTGLVNGQEYTYYVKSIGNYSIDQLQKDTLLNKSQIVVGVPVDTIPPCSPDKPKIVSECELFRNEITWNNPNHSCFYKDAVSYRLYFTPVLGNPYEIIREFTNVEDTSITFEEMESVAGCYGVTAVDSFNNESALSERVCVDNCPIYVLPNVFTPGGDGFNDLFTPIYPFRYVKDIDITIYNRWGQEMFSTTDPNIRWDGTNTENGKQAPSGVYFYVCTVNEIRLSGIIPRVLKGHVTLINEADPVINNN